MRKFLKTRTASLVARLLIFSGLIADHYHHRRLSSLMFLGLVGSVATYLPHLEPKPFPSRLYAVMVASLFVLLILAALISHAPLGPAVLFASVTGLTVVLVRLIIHRAARRAHVTAGLSALGAQPFLRPSLE
jgi:hypothetical protein